MTDEFDLKAAFPFVADGHALGSGDQCGLRDLVSTKYPQQKRASYNNY